MEDWMHSQLLSKKQVLSTYARAGTDKLYYFHSSGLCKYADQLIILRYPFDRSSCNAESRGL